MTNLASPLRLMAVTDAASRDLVARCAAAVAGGATSVQLRVKDADPAALLEAARALVAALPVPVLVNDRVDVALAAGAAGVHLGVDDLPPARVRALAPRGFLIGASVGTPDEVERGRGADYWGIGPWGATGTKADAGAPLGPVGFAALAALADGRPCLAVGAVRPADVAAVLGAGGHGVAVVSGIFAARDPRAAAAAYRAALDREAP